MKIESKLCPLESECSNGFTKIWPCDLVFDLKWPIFNSGLDFMKKKHSYKYSLRLDQNNAFYSVHIVFLRIDFMT